ncbi:MAG: hypothetical protein NC833_02905 [Candidatus Omnitrophica bacterium]|nr:hypothetical protein [Candidatus Omnitrophota bacterium]
MPVIYWDRIEGLYCKCTKGDIAIFKILENCIKCIWCGNEIKCIPPIEFVWKEKCENCEGKISTFIIDSAGNKVCSRCGSFK